MKKRVIQIDSDRLEVLVRLAWKEAGRQAEIAAISSSADRLVDIAVGARQFVKNLEKFKDDLLGNGARHRFDAIAAAASSLCEDDT